MGKFRDAVERNDGSMMRKVSEGLVIDLIKAGAIIPSSDEIFKIGEILVELAEKADNAMTYAIYQKTGEGLYALACMALAKERM